MDHSTFRELAAGAALGDLDRDETVAFAVHRDACRDCRELLEDLDRVAADLALAAPGRQPPTELRDSVLAAVHPSAATLATATGPAIGPALSIIAGGRREARGPGALPDTTGVRRSRALSFAGLAAAAVLAIVAAGLGVRSVQLADEVAAARASTQAVADRLAAQNADMAGAMTVALDPSHRTVALHAEPVAPTANAIVVYRPGSPDAYLMATDLPATPDGAVYQLWVADASGVHALRTFTFDGTGAFVAPFDHDLAGASAAMVTLEPPGGASGEPGPQVVFGEL